MKEQQTDRQTENKAKPTSCISDQSLLTIPRTNLTIGQRAFSGRLVSFGIPSLSLLEMLLLSVHSKAG